MKWKLGEYNPVSHSSDAICTAASEVEPFTLAAPHGSRIPSHSPVRDRISTHLFPRRIRPPTRRSSELPSAEACPSASPSCWHSWLIRVRMTSRLALKTSELTLLMHVQERVAPHRLVPQRLLCDSCLYNRTRDLMKLCTSGVDSKTEASRSCIFMLRCSSTTSPQQPPRIISESYLRSST